MRLHKTKNILCSKRNNRMKKQATEREYEYSQIKEDTKMANEYMREMPNITNHQANKN
jgi:hypothetical protein